MQYAEPIARLINAFSKLPGIGRKTASRLALFILNSDRRYVEDLSSCLMGVKESVGLCSTCMIFSEQDPCFICSDAARDASTICVVSDYKDLVALEDAGVYNGRYHILHGALMPLKGIGPDDIKIKELVERVEGGEVNELILATGFDSEGEVTAQYIMKLLKRRGLKLSRIASGVPVGSLIEYMDSTTLARALKGRNEM